MKRWTILFKAFGNINRLKITQLLFHGDILTVTDISEKLGISIKATSQHLAILNNLDVVEGVGKQGHVFYTLNKKIPRDVQMTIKLFVE
jgi:DNA-binding transcriptional ArsR family regulator